ncbi:hypothetical protein Goklo_005315, partial [Gossypium klotzschianum]|nr:hypothetical protein [Gossypium klotzschianum]
TIALNGCKNLRKFPKLLGAINLEDIECRECESLVELPCLNHLASLASITLHKCRSLKEFPELPKNISYLNLGETGIEEVPDSIEHLTRLEVLNLRDTMVKNVSTRISKLEHLWLLDLSYSSTAEFPEIPINLQHLRLADTEIEEVPSRFDCQSSLTLLDLSGTSITTVDVATFIRFENLEHLKMNYCHKLKLLSEVPPNLNYLEAHGCTSLEKVTFIDRNRFEVPNEIFMIFSDCFNLNKDSIDNIEQTAMFKVGAQVERWISLWESCCQSQRLFFCFPGNEISANKFEFQSLNSSINLKRAPNWRIGGRFLAFVICLVADLTNCSRYEYIERICEYQLKATSGGNEKFKTKWSDRRVLDFESVFECNGEHVLILFNNKIVKDYEEASFEFYIKGYNRWVEYRFDDIKVKKCGVHVFYVDEDQIDETSSEASDEDQIDGTSSYPSDEDQEMCNIEEMSKDVSYVEEDIPDPIALRK